MARVLFQTLTLTRLSLSPSCKPPPLISVLTVRHRSNRSGKAQLIEINLESESGDVEVMGIRRLEDAIHRIIAQRLAPDWLPFIPGSSYWVPPSRRQFDLLKCMGKLAREMSVEDALAVTAVRGWPSPSYFIQGMVNFFMHSVWLPSVGFDVILLTWSCVYAAFVNGL